jgi:hypothetical protein
LGPVSLDPYLGGELRFSSWLYARIGVGNFQLIPGLSGRDNLTVQPNLGVGIQYRNIFIDYAITNVGSVGLAQYSNLISLRYQLN